MSNDVPSDVYAVLTQLFEEGESAVLAEEFGTARRTIGTAETVCRNKLPEGELRAQLLHGCDRVQATLDPTEGANADTARSFCGPWTDGWNGLCSGYRQRGWVGFAPGPD